MTKTAEDTCSWTITVKQMWGFQLDQIKDGPVVDIIYSDISYIVLYIVFMYCIFLL